MSSIETSGCEKYIAIVVDESRSISDLEASQIRNGLTSFINSQSLSNTTLSLIGMSASDTNLRTDHVIQKRIADHKQEFLDWISAYGSRGIGAQSDYWASGLQVADNLTVTPDIIILITDGLQVKDTSILKNLYTNLNEESRIFVYGVSEVTSGWPEFVTPLSYYLGTTPVLKTSSNDILSADYFGLSDFSILGSGGYSYLATEIENAHVGCKANVEIIENHLTYPTLYVGTSVNQDAGNLVLKNKSRKTLKLIAGTVIHTSNTVDGLVFKLKYTVIIPANSQSEVAIKIEGTPLSNGSFSRLIVLENVKNPYGFNIGFAVGKEHITISNKTLLQSPSLQLQVAGSKGYDSTQGIHLRWIFAGELGEKHLPKGNLYTSNTISGFNKPNDFVKVYRSPYVKTAFNLNLTAIPTIVDALRARWIYRLAEGRTFYVQFDKRKYESITTINPKTNPALFLQAYGDNLIEIENKNELFFAAELHFSSVNSSSILRLETLSVDENTVGAAKIVSSRKTYTGTQISSVRAVVSNGRSIRFRAGNCTLNEINFEFYSDFIVNANASGSWVSKGNYGLTENDTEAFERLEPQFNCVHGKWLNFNNGEYVNTENYRHKWNRPTTYPVDKNIKQVIHDYVYLSNDITNPTAIESVRFGDAPITAKVGEDGEVEENEDGEVEEVQLPESENTTDLSNLDMLNIAACDYHVARMLGVGFLDIDSTVFSDEYMYVTEYTTFGDLKDGLGAREVQHLSMSLPTSLENERLPIPVNLSKIVPGLNVNVDGKESKKITDENGYSFDGRKRYVSLFIDEIKDYDYSTPFFSSPVEFDETTFTFPIYAGVHYRVDESPWNELAQDVDYNNVTRDLLPGSYEPAPIVIPEEFQNSFYNARQTKTGPHTHTYKGYGINIFSRATSGRQLSIDSNIKPANELMPPTGINAHLIIEENPLMFTSKNEQEKLTALKNAHVSDETYIRLLFEYYTIQELLSYSIPADMNPLLVQSDPNAIYPDNEEVFADYFEIFFRDSLPQIETAKIISIDGNQNNGLSSTVKIGNYTLISSGETIELSINSGNKDRFIGGILAIGDHNYVVQQVTIDGAFVNVEVINKEVVTSIVADGDATVDSEQIRGITIPDNQLCALIENMLTASNWRQPGPINYQVQYPGSLKTVHREVIKQKDSQGKADYQLEKTRGVWETATIERVLEVAYEKDENGIYILDEEENPKKLDVDQHQGMYKITFPGFSLPQHPQSVPNAKGNTVEWLNGIVRLFTQSSVDTPASAFPVKSRKEFKVVRTENIGGTDNLVLYVNDTNFKLLPDSSYTMDPTYDEIRVGSQKVNFYPHYNVHLLASAEDGLTKENIQPREGESNHYSIFGIRTYGTNDTTDPGSFIGYNSQISVPTPMYAVKIVAPKQPEKPLGGLYATRPDYFKRSTYTFTTKYQHKPHSLLHYRADDEMLLSVLYEKDPTHNPPIDTIKEIRENLERLGGKNEAYFTNRWQEFLDFELLATKENYSVLPPEGVSDDGYRLPMPDNKELIKAINEFIDWHNSSQVPPFVNHFTHITALNQVIIPAVSGGIATDLLAVHFIEQLVHAVFVPLTEIPVVYDLININRSPDYVPINKKQTIKDRNGYLLKSTDPELDIAPMMKIISEYPDTVTQFTDFTLDGTSQNFYFYGVREMDIQMNIGPFSPFNGPIKLVPSNPPQTPEIKRIMPILENPVLAIKPSIQIELNPYQPQQKIKKINIYRALSMLDAQSIRTMTLVKEVLITEDTLSADFDHIWAVYDEFEDLESIPFGEGLFYRITVSREIEYAEPGVADSIIIDYTPSQPSKITATIIADNVSPESPVVSATYDDTDESVLSEVALSWEKTVHNGKYHLYKMNNHGNWEKIHEVSGDNANASVVEVYLGDIGSDELIIKSEDDERIYHHFKVIAENSSGMFSNQEKILTL